MSQSIAEMIEETVPIKPEGFEDCLGPWGPQGFDYYCGEPLTWGFKLTRRIGEERFTELGKLGKLKYVGSIYDSDVIFVTHELSFEEAKSKYGPVLRCDVGPLGGWRSITFGTEEKPYEFRCKECDWRKEPEVILKTIKGR